MAENTHPHQCDSCMETGIETIAERENPYNPGYWLCWRCAADFAAYMAKD